MTWARVRAWRDRLRTIDAASLGTGLSPEGAREGLAASLDALDDAALAAVRAIGGRPFRRSVVVTTGTVFTAPIEWCAVLLGRGSEVVVKHPSGFPGVGPDLARAAVEVGLPLEVTGRREAVLDGDLVVAMGSDATIGAIRQEIPSTTRFLGHGHRFSVAWVTGREGAWDALAADAALYDGRGCLSPVAVLTPLPLALACDELAEAMLRAQARWPLGDVDPGEAAAIRTRRALAKVTGTVRENPGWSLHGLPPLHFVPAALPRSLAVISVPDARTAATVLAPHAAALSAVGTDDASTVDVWLDAGATRVCEVGRMQRPPLVRPHDGEDWLRATALQVSVELGPSGA